MVRHKSESSGRLRQKTGGYGAGERAAFGVAWVEGVCKERGHWRDSRMQGCWDQIEAGSW